MKCNYENELLIDLNVVFESPELELELELEPEPRPEPFYTNEIDIMDLIANTVEV